ncbi:CLUMA_CG019307, isoform A [Clunio marinus]|uniref:CLUMA_CG019307, isoform A n=1 Tax=Clunio marinus TaxID=568069 RepID=A0A1J1J5I2_9DIPT|nr:CLUMA_CG019307, isoform A [Clunio marinus]
MLKNSYMEKKKQHFMILCSVSSSAAATLMTQVIICCFLTVLLKELLLRCTFYMKKESLKLIDETAESYVWRVHVLNSGDDFHLKLPILTIG